MPFSAARTWAKMVDLEVNEKYGQLEILAGRLTRPNLEALCRYGLKATQGDMDDADDNQLWDAVYVHVQKDGREARRR